MTDLRGDKPQVKESNNFVKYVVAAGIAILAVIGANAYFHFLPF